MLRKLVPPIHKAPTTEETTPMARALHKHLQQLAGKPLSIRTLMEIEKTAAAGRELLCISKDERAERRGKLQFDTDFQLMDEAPEIGTYQTAGVYGGTQGGAETFGATVVRELMTVLGQLNQPKAPSPFELVMAMNTAQQNGMHDVSNTIKSALTASLSPPGGPEKPAAKALKASAKEPS